MLQRTVPYGTNAVVTEVMDEKDVDATTAMTLLQNERLITVDFDDNAATGAFRYLINNIGRVIDYYVTKNPDKPIDDVFLTGDGALIRGIDGLFKIQLNIQTRIMDSLYNVKFDPKIDLKIYNPVYLIAPIGAAFAPMGFRPTEVKTKGSASDADLMKYGVAVLVVGVIVAAASIGVTTVMKNNEQAKQASLNAQIAAIADIDQIISDYDAVVAKYKDIKTMYDQTRTLNENFNMLFDDLEKNQPKDVSIQSFNSSDGGVNIGATAKSLDAIAKFIIQLKKIECIDNAFVPSYTEEVDDAGNKTYTFTVTANFVSMVQDEDAELEEQNTGDATLDTPAAE